MDYQARLLAAISPYVESGGTAAAFVTDAADPDISPTTVDRVEVFVPAQVGDVHPAGIADLGNNGTARHQLEAWPVAS